MPVEMPAYRRQEDLRQVLAPPPVQWTGPSPFKRVPLTAGQHILHLLLTVLTLGLWAPVWIVRAARGNPNPRYYEWLYWQRWQQMNAGPQPPAAAPGRMSQPPA